MSAPTQVRLLKPGIRNGRTCTPWVGAMLVLALLVGCGGGINADIKAAAEFQATAQAAYEVAKGDELAALMRCRDAAISAGTPLPQGLSHGEVESRCKNVGAALPYPLGFLDGLHDGAAGLYDAVQATIAAQDAAGADSAATKDARARMIGALVALLKDVGVLNIPPDKTAAAKSLAAKR